MLEQAFHSMRKLFHVSTEEEIKSANTTHIYFVGTKEILEREGLRDLRVVAEITTGSLPRNWPQAILAGVG